MAKDEIEAVMAAITARDTALVAKIEGLRMELTKDESNSDWFYGYGNNSALDAVIRLIQTGG